MFADIQGFSGICETEELTALLDLLNKCLTVISDCISQYGGTLDKYIGDCGMAFWNGQSQGEAEMQACRCALEIRERIDRLSASDASGSERKLTVNIGINHGNAIIGNIGSENHANFSIIGDSVNVAERLLEEANNGKIYISESVKKWAEGAFCVHFVKNAVLKGRIGKTDIYELEPVASDHSQE